MSRVRRNRLLGAIPAALLALVSTLQAATITVTSSADSGPGTLRDAVATAANGDEIRFSSTLDRVPIELTTGEIVLNKELSFAGRGPDKTLIQGPGRFVPEATAPTRLFTIAPEITARFSDLSLSGGFVGFPIGGGAILNYGTLSLNNCWVTGNTSLDVNGAGIHNAGGSLTASNTQFRENFIDSGSTAGGGAIYNDSQGLAVLTGCFIANQSAVKGKGAGIYNDGTMTISSTRLSENLASTGGAAIFNPGGTLHILDSIIDHNRSGISSAVGGAIVNGGSLTIERSTIKNNSSETGGGGIANSGNALLINTTLFGNEAHTSGGGIRNSGGNLSLVHSTIAGNSVDNDNYYQTGGIDNGNGSTGIVVARNSLILGNYSASCQVTPERTTCPKDCIGEFVSEGRNLTGPLSVSDQYHDEVFDVCSGFSAQGDRVAIAVHQVTDYEVVGARLGRPIEIPVLRDNGGATPTIALLPAGAAIDNVPLDACTDFDGNPVPADQRGVERPQGSACDSGAFEAQPHEGTPFWKRQCGDHGSREVGEAQMQRFLGNVVDESPAFPECVPVDCSTFSTTGKRDEARMSAVREILALWLNVVSGRLPRSAAVSLPELTTAGSVEDAIHELERTLCGPASRSELAHAEDLARALNSGEGTGP